MVCSPLLVRYGAIEMTAIIIIKQTVRHLSILVRLVYQALSEVADSFKLVNEC